MKNKIWIGIILAALVIAALSYFYITASSQPSSENEINGTAKTSGEASEDDLILKTACKNAVNDYPNWTVPSTDLLIWEDSDKKFNFRTAPENLSAGITSPVSSSETLVDMDFIGLDKISYATKNSNIWKIGLLKLNGMNSPNNSLIYEKQDNLDFLDISPINEKEFIIFFTKGGASYLSLLSTEKSTSENLSEFPSATNNNEKLAVSPKGNYVYLLYNNLLIFDISSKTKIEEINSVNSAVWIGDSYLLYSTSEGAFIYDIQNKEKNKISRIEPESTLSFNPKEEGIIAYSSDSQGKIVNCQTWWALGSLQEGYIKTFASEKTAIIYKENAEQYWRFKNSDWTVKPSHIAISNFATVWKRY